MTAAAPVSAPPGLRARPAGSPLTGTGRLFRFALLRDRLRIAAWALALGGLVGYFGAVIPLAYGDQAALQSRAAIMKDPSAALLSGPGYGLEHYTLGAMLAHEVLGLLAVAAALMSVFLVVRHTRAEEESGRAELVRAGVVGRYAPLTAALGALLVSNLAVAAVLAAAMLGNGLAAADSAALALGVGGVGVVFGTVAAATSQLSQTARTATGLAGAVLGLAYLLRGIGDARRIGGSALSWLSPIGWSQQTRTFVDLRWWPLLLEPALAAFLCLGAYLLVSRRDLGAGLLAARGGRSRATRVLATPAGLVHRAERGSILGWCLGLFTFALLTGSMGQAIVESFEAQPGLAAVIGGPSGGDVLRSALSAFLKYFAMAVAVHAVLTVHRLRWEEDSGRAGLLLAAGAGRVRLLLNHLAVTLGADIVLLLAAGFGLGAGAASTVGTGAADLPLQFTAASLAYLPLVSAFAALAALAYGLRTGSWWVWLLLVSSLVIGLYGPILRLPEFLLDAEPFGLVPAVPSVPLEGGPLLWMGAVALVLLAAAAAAFRRRDLSA
ncbi:ABC transporter permease [Arthrobacter sp. TMN-37]